MSGNEILVDTNVIIYLLQGDDTLAGILTGKQLYVSFITELELFGLNNRTKEYERLVESFLSDCFIVPMNNNILLHYKALRKAYKLKLADTLIAATAMAMNVPLITADKQFTEIRQLDLYQYER